jgi:hypothetical protein
LQSPFAANALILSCLTFGGHSSCKNRAFSGFLHGNAAYKSIDLGGEMHGVKRLKLRRAYKRLIPKRIWPLIVLPKIYLELPTLNT